MAGDGVYSSQFVTGTSNGGLTAHPGGDRWRWESRISAGAYDDAAPDQRPAYGALNYRRDPVGGGSSAAVDHPCRIRYGEIKCRRRVGTVRSAGGRGSRTSCSLAYREPCKTGGGDRAEADEVRDQTDPRMGTAVHLRNQRRISAPLPRWSQPLRSDAGPVCN